MKLYKSRSFLILGIAFLIVLCKSLSAAEVDKGLIILDRKPWKISWVKEADNTWALLANFDKGELRTYFKKAPPPKGFGLSRDNKPIKQEFKYYPSGKTFVSKKCQFEQWEDGAKAYSFEYDKKFKIEDGKFSMGSTAIIEEVDGAPNEIRYSFGRDY